MESCLAAKRHDFGADKMVLEQEIYWLVHELYGLTEKEIEMVEEVKWK